MEYGSPRARGRGVESMARIRAIWWGPHDITREGEGGLVTQPKGRSVLDTRFRASRSKHFSSVNPSETIMGEQWTDPWPLGIPMLSREERNPLSEWWWTVDRLQLGAIFALALGGTILSLAASPPVATRIGLDPFHFFHRHVLFLLPSFIVLLGVSFLSPRQTRRSALIVFGLSVVLIAATLLFGPEVKGSR